MQLDDTKTPAQPITIRCPKCQAAVKLQPSGSAESGSPGPLSGRGLLLERPVAPRFALDHEAVQSSAESTAAVADLNDLAKLLVEALGKGDGFGARARTKMRKVLVCAPADYRLTAACSLAEHGYEVFVAEDTPQALGRMREGSMDVILLDASFDPVEQGTAFVTREIKSLRPAQRRRLFLVYLSSSLRTMDHHAAFLHSVNLVFNPSDIDQLPEVLDVAIRNYNELCRDYFAALNVAAI